MDPTDADTQPALFGELLDRFTEIVGPAASEATFHYASIQEGMRIAAAYRNEGLAAAVARLDRLLGHCTRVASEEPGCVVLAVHGSRLLASGHAARQAVVLGVVEGMLRVVRGQAHVGRVAGQRGRETLLEFRVQ